MQASELLEWKSDVGERLALDDFIEPPFKHRGGDALQVVHLSPVELARPSQRVRRLRDAGTAVVGGDGRELAVEGVLLDSLKVLVHGAGLQIGAHADRNKRVENSSSDGSATRIGEARMTNSRRKGACLLRELVEKEMRFAVDVAEPGHFRKLSIAGQGIIIGPGCPAFSRDLLMSQKNKAKQNQSALPSDPPANSTLSRVDGAAVPFSPAEACQVPAMMNDGVYYRERAHLSEIEQKSADQHDKAILTLSMAALGVSITFLDKIAATPVPETLIILFIAWGFLVASIVAIVASFQFSQWACRYQQALYDKERETGEEQKQKNRYSTWTSWLNVAAYIFFVGGVCSLLLFSGLNLWISKEPNMGDSQIQQQTGEPHEHRGIVPPSAPARPSMPEPKSVPPLAEPQSTPTPPKTTK